MDIEILPTAANLMEVLPIDPPPIAEDYLIPDDIGREELNFAEFPLAVLSNNANDNVVTYSDQIWDAKNKRAVTRTLEITGCKRYGLPTAANEEILLGMQQLAYINGFREPKVSFTIYQLLKILGWKDNGQNYKRAQDGLNCWLGVTLRYIDAWREKHTDAEDEWTSKGFHVIEDLTLHSKDNRHSRQSSFTWNSHIFKNLSNGHHKPINLAIFRSLRNPTAKRIYRFLDKRFYLNESQDFPLETFVLQKVGVSRNFTDPYSLKRAIAPALKELEKLGYIQEEKNRFVQDIRGWRVVFKKARPVPKTMGLPNDVFLAESKLLTSQLESFGVTPHRAKTICKNHPEDYILQKIDELEFILSQPKRDTPKNLAGFLVESITKNYATPSGFIPRIERERLRLETLDQQKQRENVFKQKIEREQESEKKHEEQHKRYQQLVAVYIESLTPEQKEDLYDKALEPFSMLPNKTELIVNSAVHAYVVNNIINHGVRDISSPRLL